MINGCYIYSRIWSLTGTAEDAGRVAFPISTSKLLKNTVDLLCLGFEVKLATETPGDLVSESQLRTWSLANLNALSSRSPAKSKLSM